MASSMTDRDWKSLLEIVQRTYDATNVDEVEKIALSCIRTLIPAKQGIMFISEKSECRDNPSGLCRPCVSGEPALFIEEFLSGRYLDGQESEFFFSGKNYLGHSTETARDSDQISEEYLVNSEIYKKIYIPQGIHYVLRSLLVHKGNFVGSIELFNSKEQGDFTDRQLEMLSVVAPYVAARVGTLLEEEDAKRERDAFDKMKWKTLYGLTARELEVLSHIIKGKEDEQIIETLFISPATLKKHLSNIYRKVGVNDRAGLFRKHLENR